MDLLVCFLFLEYIVGPRSTRNEPGQKITFPQVRCNLSPTDDAQREIHRDAVQPGEKSGIVAEISQRKVCLHECFLGNVISVCMVSRHSSRNPVDAFLVPVHQAGERLPVPFANLLDILKICGFLHTDGGAGVPIRQSEPGKV